MPIVYSDIAAFCEERFVQSGGPGGQNVNKVATTVQLRFDLAGCDTIPDAAKARIRRKLESRLTKDGELLVRASEHRSQDRNREAARSRLITTLNEAAQRQAYRVPTRPSLSAKKKRADSKTKRGQVKKLRGRVKPGNE